MQSFVGWFYLLAAVPIDIVARARASFFAASARIFRLFLRILSASDSGLRSKAASIIRNMLAFKNKTNSQYGIS